MNSMLAAHPKIKKDLVLKGKRNQRFRVPNVNLKLF